MRAVTSAGGAAAAATLSRRERVLVLAALASVVALAWSYLAVRTAGVDMASMAEGTMRMMPSPWTKAHFVLMALMWAVMMVAMMLPSAAPMVLTYAAVARRLGPQHGRMVPVALFAMGYVLTWSAFSLGATTLQCGLERAALLSSGMTASSPLLGGGLLIAAGLYQWSPLKTFCLDLCRMPLAFIARHWRAGATGALRMGLLHGLYCVGCCWCLMLLLFVGGVMNLLWVAAISAFVLLEKLVGTGTPAGRRLSGGGMIAAGVLLLLRGP